MITSQSEKNPEGSAKIVTIEKEEFVERANRIKEIMRHKKLDSCVVFGDEYRREYVRYISNFWPIFEKSSVFIFPEREPILGVSPECEYYAKETSVWRDIRNMHSFGAVTVPDNVDFPLARIYTFDEIFDEFVGIGQMKRVGVVGLDLVTVPLYDLFRKSIPNCEVVDITDPFNQLRIVKTENEIACLRKAAKLADVAYEHMIQICQPGLTELEMAAEAEYTARKNGAELVPFCNVSSGERTNTIIGRATEKRVKDGELISAAIAVQYYGYIATVQFPFVVGETFSKVQKELIESLLEAERLSLDCLQVGVKASEFVKQVRDYFRRNDLSQYDIYPPLHGIGTAEAESPYPDEETETFLQPGMVVNTDISLFGTKAFSNRIEEGFVITENGYEPLSSLVRRKITEYAGK